MSLNFPHFTGSFLLMAKTRAFFSLLISGGNTSTSGSSASLKFSGLQDARFVLYTTVLIAGLMFLRLSLPSGERNPALNLAVSMCS